MGHAAPHSMNDLDEETFQTLYGRWDPVEPAQVAELFAGASLRWWIGGGRAARAGAQVRRPEDTDVAVRLDDLDELRQQLSDWPAHLSRIWSLHFRHIGLIFDPDPV